MDFTKCVNMARDLMDQHIPTAIITGNEYQQTRYSYSYPQYITSKQWLLGFYSYRKDYKVETIGFCKGLKLSGGNNSVYYNKVNPEAKYSEDDPNFKVYDNPHYYKLDSPTIALNWRFVATNKEHVVRSVILHEIAHAIHFIKYEINPRKNRISGHTKEFRQICKDLGLTKKGYRCNQGHKGEYSSDAYNTDRVESKYRRFLGYKQRSRRGHKFWDRDSIDKTHVLYQANRYAGSYWYDSRGRCWKSYENHTLKEMVQYFEIDSKNSNSIGVIEYA